MKIFVILSSVLFVAVWAQTTVVPDATAAVTASLGPIVGTVDGKAQVTSAVLNNVQNLVNTDTASTLTGLANAGLTSSLTSQFDALSLITDTVADIPEALICAVNASTALLGSIASGAASTVNCLLNKVLGVPNLLLQVGNVVSQLVINSLTNTLSLITSCVASKLLAVDIPGALGCAGSIIASVLAVVNGLLTTIVSLLGQAIILVLGLVSCALSTLATVLAIAGSALASAVACVSQIALIDILLPPLNSLVPDVNAVVQAAINLILQLDAVVDQIQTLIANLTNSLNALITKILGLTAQVIENALKNAVTSLLNVISNAVALNLAGPALNCVNVASQNVAALLKTGVSAVSACVANILNVAQQLLAEVLGSSVSVISQAVSSGIPAVVGCAVGALSLSRDTVKTCVDNIVNQLTQLVTLTLNRLQAIAVQVQALVAAVDQCLTNAINVLIQAVQLLVDTLRTCLAGFGVTI